MKKFENINDLQLTNVNVMKVVFENAAVTDSGNSIPVRLKFDLALRNGFDILANKAIVKVFIQIDSLNLDSVTTNITAKFDINFIFDVASLGEYISEGEGRQIDASLSGILLSTAYSTARGIIHTRCLGTVLGNVLIPILPVHELMQLADKNPF